tara:strand:+ start:1543 stop:1905 length:363 start_codon:yes stop_codon:yes gene_type:complete
MKKAPTFLRNRYQSSRGSVTAERWSPKISAIATFLIIVGLAVYSNSELERMEAKTSPPTEVPVSYNIRDIGGVPTVYNSETGEIMGILVDSEENWGKIHRKVEDAARILSTLPLSTPQTP